MKILFFNFSMLLLSQSLNAADPNPGQEPNLNSELRRGHDVFQEGNIAPMMDGRMKGEQKAKETRFAITAWAPNYILPVSYSNGRNSSIYPGIKGEEPNLDKVEVKFQFSFKVNLLSSFVNNNGNLFVAYTQQSQWQAYNSDISSPFRENNYEPEVVFTYVTDWHLLGFHNRIAALGLVHQSNGQLGDLSRSWNRVYAMFGIEKGNFAFALKPWYRLEESLDDDDNPDILDYMGYGEFNSLYRYGDNQFGMMLRNNLTSDNKGAIQLNWQFPLYNDLHGYIQYFNGYGESLIDYNYYSNSVGIGIALTDWL